MQQVDRIEKRRFVGREFLFWLWFESEVFGATLATRKHGPFGLWLERKLVLSAEKESTRITAALPGAGREAKEALLRGQLPQSAGIRIAWRETETSFVLNAEQLSLSGLKLQTALGKDEEAPSPLLEEMKGGGRKRKQAPALPDESDVTREAFYERMRLTQELEALLEALYADFVALRLSSLWASAVVPAARAWAQGRDVDADAYRRARTPKSKAQSKRA
jgi:hypothetical protein